VLWFVFSGCSLVVTLYVMRKDPKLLARRVAAGPVAEARPRQKVIQALASIAFLLVLVVPALDHRFAWSHPATAIVVLGDALVGAGFALVFMVFRENTYASAVIEVGAEQRVVATGPYSHVRHPMYSGGLVLVAGIPLALRSYWGLLTLAPFAALIVWRLLDEEHLLSGELPGYDAYCRSVPYRLMPRVW